MIVNSNATKDVNCNNIDIKMANTDMTCNNKNIENESKMDYKSVKCDDNLLSHINDSTEQCDILPLSLEDSPPNVLDVEITTPDDEDHNIEMSVSSNNEEKNYSSYDSDISDCSCHSCTTVSSSDDSIILTLVRVSREIMDEIGNKECWLLFPKLPQLTIDYWKNRNTKNQTNSEHIEDDGVKTSLDKTGDTTEIQVINSDICDSNNVMDNDTEVCDLDKVVDNDTTDVKPNKTADNHDSNSTSAIEDHRPGVNTVELSEYTSPSSESDSLINPTKAKPTRRVRKRVNYSNMCESDSSSDEDSEDTKTKPKEKPTPGAAPSLSRL